MAYEPRQNVGSYEGLSHTIDWALEIDYDVALSNGRETLKSTLEKFNFINTSRTIEFYALPAVKAISFAITRGDEISDISTKLMQPSVPRLIHACKDIDELELSGQEFFWGAAAESVGKPYKHFMFPCEVLNVMVMVSHCLHFGVGNDDLRAFAPYLAPPGKSKIADAVLSHFFTV